MLAKFLIIFKNSMLDLEIYYFKNILDFFIVLFASVLTKFRINILIRLKIIILSRFYIFLKARARPFL